MKKVALTLIVTSAALATSGCQKEAPASEPSEAAPAAMDMPAEPAVEAPVDAATDAVAAPDGAETPAAGTAAAE